ncbi:alpha/beta fold hydrolase [Aquirufa sp. ROCK-SH2]
MGSPSIIFLHGFGEDHRMWDDFLPHFEWKSSYFCPDFAHWTDCKHLSDYAHKLMNSLPAESTFNIVGHSMGGYIALELAKLYPDRILKVVMLNSTAFPDSDEKKLNRDKTATFIQNVGVEKFIGPFVPNLFSSEFSEKNPTVIQTLIQRYQTLSAEGLIAATIAMKNRMDGRELLKATSIPFLFIHGALDGMISKADIQECIQLNSNLHQMVVFSQSAHQSAYEESEKCFETIHHFFN